MRKSTDDHIADWIKLWFIAFGLFSIAIAIGLVLEGLRR